MCTSVLVLSQPEVQLDHVFYGLEPPLDVVAALLLQCDHLLEQLQRLLRLILHNKEAGLAPAHQAAPMGSECLG